MPAEPRLPVDEPVIPKHLPPPPALAWLLEASPQTLIRLIDLCLAAERGELPWSSVLAVVQRPMVCVATHDNILSTSPNQDRQQKVSDSDHSSLPMTHALQAISGAATLWFGRLSGEKKLVLIRQGLQSGFVPGPLLVSSLRESLIAATTSVSSP